jgi:hypothetical protein
VPSSSEALSCRFVLNLEPPLRQAVAQQPLF